MASAMASIRNSRPPTAPAIIGIILPPDAGAAVVVGAAVAAVGNRKAVYAEVNSQIRGVINMN